MESSALNGNASQPLTKVAAPAAEKSKEAAIPNTESKREAATVKINDTTSAQDQSEQQIPPAERTNAAAVSGAI
jgi:hypothetical protein